MRCAPTVVLQAGGTVRRAIRQLTGVPARTPVVVVRDHDGRTLYYVFPADTLRRALGRAPADLDLGTALQLHEFQAAPARQLDATAAVGTVALEGREVVGVLVDDATATRSATPGGTRGPTAAPTRGPTAAPTRGPSRGPDPGPTRGPGVPLAPPPSPPSPPPPPPPPTFEPPTFDQPPFEPPAFDLPGTEISADLPDGGPVAESPGADSAAAEPPPELAVFRAFPDAKAPAQVGAQSSFTLDVGFAAAPSVASPGATPILVMAPQQVDFVVQVVGFGFSFPDGMRRDLRVDRDRPLGQRATFTVLADDVTVAAPRILEVSYEYRGVVVGRTWVQVTVVPGAPDVGAGGQQAPSGGTGLLGAELPGDGPHLSVDILHRDGSPELRWVFHCRYPDVVRPGEVTTRLDDDSARSFAVQLMAQLPGVQQGDWLVATVTGVGDEVADALPREFWSVFEQTWERARTDGEQPRLLITTSEPWIPWELAHIGADRLHDPTLLPTPADGGSLGQLWEIGRWTPPTRFLAAGDVPASPPAAVVEMADIAVVIGNYAGDAGVTELPEAVAEGNDIALAYGALPLSASVEDVTRLMRDTLERNGVPFRPTGLHFAGHGEVDVENPQFTGVVLYGGQRLDRLAVKGFDLVGKERPFVFLNACEVGVAGQTLNELGGLAGAFLVEGARGFVAPLWKVNDVEAREVALEFYRRTLDDGQTVGEAMRGIRQKYTRDAKTSATALAYVFYGSPDLRLTRSAP